MNTRLLLLLTLGVWACAPGYDDVSTKLVGVGYDPEEIGPSPTPYGGVVEYSWVNFAGGGLSLALMGLGSFDEVGPNYGGYTPPYAAVYGFSYVFDSKLSSADSLAGVTSVPPEVEDSCYTTFDAGGPMGSFKTVDIGSWMDISTPDADRTGGFKLDRYPGDYPANPQDVFAYYIGFDYWQRDPVYAKVASADGNRDIDSLESELVRRDNFPFGQEVEFRFPGAITDMTMPVASLPRPSSSVDGGNTRYTLPNEIGGVMMEWQGPIYDRWGNVLDDAADKQPQKTCLTFAPPEAGEPVDPTDCIAADHPNAASFEAQVYTGPWDTEDGVTFRWDPGDNPDEIVSLAVRFLGPVDRDDPNYKEEIVYVTPDGGAERLWEDAQEAGDVPLDATIEDGRRAPLACEEGEWVFDDANEDHDGDLAPHLRGDPFHNVAEVTCRLADDGEFTLTQARLEEALAYAQRNNAEGAIFYFARSTEVAAKVPAAKDQYDQRLDISPVKVTSRAIDIGRFWFEE
jgi:hypothetical protein